MNRLIACLLSAVIIALGSLSYGLHAQNVTNPAPVAESCAYNTSPPSVTSGQFVLGQCDQFGNRLSSFGGGAATTSGALAPPTAAAGKATRYVVSISANTNTQLLAANANRIGYSIQCDGTAIVAISQLGTTLTAAPDTNTDLVIPAGSYPYFTPLMASLTAINAYTGTTQTCRGLDYSK